MAKIAIIGAGGYVFPLRLVGDLLSFPELRGATLALMDVDPGRLERTAGAVRELVAHHRLPTRVEATTDRRRALARIAELDRRIAEQKAAVVQLEAVESYCCRVKANLADLSFERRRDAVETLIDRVVGNGPHPGNWRIEAAIPLGVPSNIGCRSGR